MTDRPNPLAVDIRTIAEALTLFEAHRQAEQLADRVERYAANPANPDDPAEQTIRSNALTIAVDLLGDCSGTSAGIAARLIELAEPIADWIRDGSQPQ